MRLFGPLEGLLAGDHVRHFNPFKDSWSDQTQAVTGLDPRTILNPGSMLSDQVGVPDPVDMSIGIDPAQGWLAEQTGYGETPNAGQGGIGGYGQAGYAQMPMFNMFGGDSVDPSYARGLAALGQMGYGQQQGGPIFGGNYADLNAGTGNISGGY